MKNFEWESEPFEWSTCLVACKFIDLRQDMAINNKRDSVSRDFFRGKVETCSHEKKHVKRLLLNFGNAFSLSNKY